MNRNLPFVLITLAAFIVMFSFSCQNNTAHVRQKTGKPKRAGSKYDDIAGAYEYEFNLLKNPVSGKIPENVREQELLQAKEIMQKQNTSGNTSLLNSYFFEGPNNMGGRTRSVVYDVRFNGTTNRMILAGGVSGGIFKSTDNGASWVRKSPVNELYSVTGIAQDPRAGFQDTWYYTTGEAIGNSATGASALYFGNGVYKSTDNGETWSRLTASNPSALETFTLPNDLMSKVVVNPVNGHIYVACCGTIIRSTTGGAAWQTVLAGTLTNSSQVTDIAVTSTGRFYAAFAGTNVAGSDGVWTSTTGAGGSWTNIATGGAPTGWNANGTYGRVVLAIAPSNENLVYALYWNGYTSNCASPAPEAELFLWNQSASAWADRTAGLPDEAGCSSGNDPFGVQGGYCMSINVKPDDPNVVFIGGTNLYRSTDGFSTRINTTRIGGYANANNYSLYANSHPDIHAVTFQPGSPNIMLCGNDGGIQRTTDNLAATVSWSQINNGFRTYQFYSVTNDPASGSNKVMGGAQDNGTSRNIGGTGTSFESVFGGDGVSVGLANMIAGINWEYFGTQRGKIYTKESTSPNGFAYDITPLTAGATGLFVTLFHLDPDNTENLYYADNNSLYRTGSASTVDGTSWTNLSGFETAVGSANDITALTTTRGVYNPATATLFAGTSNGKIFRLNNPVNAAASTVPTDISSASFSGYVSSISVNPRNDDTVIVTFSNYGVTSVFWTGNANSATPTWQNVEGNLTLPSFRSSAILVKNNIAEYYVGTSAGLYGATINGTSPGTTTWAQESPATIGNALVTSLALRTSDNKLLAGTHGYGMWSSIAGTVLPVSLLNFSGNLQSNAILLNWRTAAEYNSREFRIEKSTDSTNFRTIGTVQAAGSSNIVKNYDYTDRDIAETNYYRLKMIDIDGSAKQSNTIVIKNKGQEQDMIILTNPFTDYIDIRFSKMPAGKVTVSLTDMSGKRIAAKDFYPSSAAILRFDNFSKSLEKGMYILQAETGRQRFSKKIVKQ